MSDESEDDRLGTDGRGGTDMVATYLLCTMVHRMVHHFAACNIASRVVISTNYDQKLSGWISAGYGWILPQPGGRTGCRQSCTRRVPVSDRCRVRYGVPNIYVPYRISENIRVASGQYGVITRYACRAKHYITDYTKNTGEYGQNNEYNSTTVSHQISHCRESIDIIVAST